MTKRLTFRKLAEPPPKMAERAVDGVPRHVQFSEIAMHEECMVDGIRLRKIADRHACEVLHPMRIYHMRGRLVERVDTLPAPEVTIVDPQWARRRYLSYGAVPVDTEFRRLETRGPGLPMFKRRLGADDLFGATIAIHPDEQVQVSERTWTTYCSTAPGVPLQSTANDAMFAWDDGAPVAFGRVPEGHQFMFDESGQVATKGAAQSYHGYGPHNVGGSIPNGGLTVRVSGWTFNVIRANERRATEDRTRIYPDD